MVEEEQRSVIPSQLGNIHRGRGRKNGALIGLSLNSLTILSFCKNPELRTPSRLLVLNLALADSGISLNALVTATSSFLWYQSPPQFLGSGVRDDPYSSTLSACRNFTSFLFTMAFFNFILPVFITHTSYQLMEQKLRKTGNPQVPALIAKMVPTINAVNYALGTEMVHREIWQCLSLRRSERDRAQRASLWGCSDPGPPLPPWTEPHAKSPACSLRSQVPDTHPPSPMALMSLALGWTQGTQRETRLPGRSWGFGARWT
ncbi:PREDICTED: RPE-retinal G protein-coupled receptor [Hipposideros armiger]|uniref:RPE-retinal G protein-coupled receptor n=1 Tax=Hipposideros armiger TaxID=186990 RepID=A0A8B7Q2C5_HIPAR|nr:PREDICTED: RPE-retinal G protein-coupled receptor [Hipposideros armiger]